MPFDIQSGSVTSSASGGKFWVDFPREFHSTPTVMISVSGFDLDLEPAKDFNFAVTAEDVTTKGFNAVFHISGRLRSVNAAWLAHS